MAISAAVFVGGIGPWKDALTAKAKSLKVGPTGVTVPVLGRHVAFAEAIPHF